MCKIMAIPGIKKEKVKDVMRFVNEATKHMSKIPDNDGVGYAAITKEGKIYGEKWLNPSDAWNVHSNPKQKNNNEKGDSFLKDHYNDFLWIINNQTTKKDKLYAHFGQKKAKNIEDTVGVVLHTRNKTRGEKNITDTHPFYTINDEHYNDVALIHNGTIENHHKLEKISSTCDSETILREWQRLNMGYEPENIEELSETLVGTYAVALLSSLYYEDQQEPVPFLDIFRSNKPLVCAFISELDTIVFSTTEDVIKNTCVALKYNEPNIHTVREGYLGRINAITGTPLENPIKFNCSKQWESYTRVNTGASNNFPGKNHNTANNTNTTSETKKDQMKRDFEKDHSSLFEDIYYSVADLTDNEKATLKELETDPNVCSRALALVRRSLASGE